MARFLCVLYSNKEVISNLEFNCMVDYYYFLSANRQTIEWAKLINKTTGDTVDFYQQFEKIDFSQSSIQIDKNDFPISTELLVLNKQKLVWLKLFISRYLDNYDIPHLTTVPLKSVTGRNPKVETSNHLVVTDKVILLNLANNIMIYCENSEYKKRVFKEMVDLTGLSIPLLNKSLLRKE